MGKLYIVPTPIGNLDDITLRAIKVLKEVDLILAEDTRTSGKLLKHFEIGTQMQSHHMHNEHKMVDRIVERLKSGETIALISDAGTPAISDPGFLLTRTCIQNNIEVDCSAIFCISSSVSVPLREPNNLFTLVSNSPLFSIASIVFSNVG